MRRLKDNFSMEILFLSYRYYTAEFSLAATGSSMTGKPLAIFDLPLLSAQRIQSQCSKICMIVGNLGKRLIQSKTKPFLDGLLLLLITHQYYLTDVFYYRSAVRISIHSSLRLDQRGELAILSSIWYFLLLQEEG